MNYGKPKTILKVKSKLFAWNVITEKKILYIFKTNNLFMYTKFNTGYTVIIASKYIFKNWLLYEKYNL